MNVLIVEDDEAIANLLYMDLSDEGYQCVCANDGKTAADILEERQEFDLILLDIMLPEIDGYELLEYMKGAILQIQSCSISTTQGNNRITGRSPNEDPILMVSQKPETSNQTNDSLQ